MAWICCDGAETRLSNWSLIPAKACRRTPKPAMGCTRYSATRQMEIIFGDAAISRPGCNCCSVPVRMPTGGKPSPLRCASQQGSGKGRGRFRCSPTPAPFCSLNLRDFPAAVDLPKDSFLAMPWRLHRHPVSGQKFLPTVRRRRLYLRKSSKVMKVFSTWMARCADRTGRGEGRMWIPAAWQP